MGEEPFQYNNWRVTLPAISFMEKMLSGHRAVKEHRRSKDIVFRITRVDGKSGIVAVLVEEYTVSVADVISLLDEFSEINCIVTNGGWNYYSMDAKHYASENGVGLFNTPEFVGALNREDFVSYEPPGKDK